VSRRRSFRLEERLSLAANKLAAREEWVALRGVALRPTLPGGRICWYARRACRNQQQERQLVHSTMC
jgi:hypothetical protein